MMRRLPLPSRRRGRAGLSGGSGLPPGPARREAGARDSAGQGGGTGIRDRTVATEDSGTRTVTLSGPAAFNDCRLSN
eukprot:764217-Hanusia_phi.AAC.2